MTNNEAAEIMKAIIFILKNDDYSDEVEEAIHMAINALTTQPELTDEQAIEHLRESGWMQNHDKQMYEMGLREQLADDSDSYDALLPSAQISKLPASYRQVTGKLDCISRQAAMDFVGSMEMCDEISAEAYQELMNYLEELPLAQPEPQWIPCIERLPEEDGGLYLVTDYSKSIGRRRRHISRCYMNKLGFWSDVPIGYEVVAWMPLPEPYVEKEIQ